MKTLIKLFLCLITIKITMFSNGLHTTRTHALLFDKPFNYYAILVRGARRQCGGMLRRWRSLTDRKAKVIRAFSTLLILLLFIRTERRDGPRAMVSDRRAEPPPQQFWRGPNGLVGRFALFFFYIYKYLYIYI